MPPFIRARKITIERNVLNISKLDVDKTKIPRAKAKGGNEKSPPVPH
jgi:hypothetical protein